jgi:hypothetical protein
MSEIKRHTGMMTVFRLTACRKDAWIPANSNMQPKRHSGQAKRDPESMDFLRIPLLGKGMVVPSRLQTGMTT